MPAPALVIRRTSPADLPAVARLFGLRDGHPHDPEVLSTFLWGLDPKTLLGWIAYAGDEPAGLSCLYLRNLAWAGAERTVGYWSHLFVREEFRRQMAYPRLVASMIKESPADGVELIYTATRRRAVADTHKKMGFSDLGEYQVLLKPIRPFGLLGRYHSNPLLTALAPALDLPFTFASALRAPGEASMDPKPARSFPEAMVRGLPAPGEVRIGQRWTPEAWTRRFGTTIQAEPYRIIDGTDGTGGRAMLTLARRSREGAAGEPIRLCVIMDLWADPGREASAAAVLRNAETYARREGCHGLIWLDGLPEWTGLFRRLGYRTTPETYTLLAWPRAGVLPGAFGSDRSHWRFPFSEHDAF